MSEFFVDLATEGRITAKTLQAIQLTEMGRISVEGEGVIPDQAQQHRMYDWATEEHEIISE